MTQLTTAWTSDPANGIVGNSPDTIESAFYPSVRQAQNNTLAQHIAKVREARIGKYTAQLGHNVGAAIDDAVASGVTDAELLAGAETLQAIIEQGRQHGLTRAQTEEATLDMLVARAEKYDDSRILKFADEVRLGNGLPLAALPKYAQKLEAAKDRIANESWRLNERWHTLKDRQDKELGEQAMLSALEKYDALDGGKDLFAEEKEVALKTGNYRLYASLLETEQKVAEGEVVKESNPSVLAEHTRDAENGTLDLQYGLEAVANRTLTKTDLDALIKKNEATIAASPTVKSDHYRRREEQLVNAIARNPVVRAGQVVGYKNQSDVDAATMELKRRTKAALADFRAKNEREPSEDEADLIVDGVYDKVIARALPADKDLEENLSTRALSLPPQRQHYLAFEKPEAFEPEKQLYADTKAFTDNVTEFEQSGTGFIRRLQLQQGWSNEQTFEWIEQEAKRLGLNYSNPMKLEIEIDSPKSEG